MLLSNYNSRSALPPLTYSSYYNQEESSFSPYYGSGMGSSCANLKVPYSPVLPRITLTDPLHLSNVMAESTQRQRSRSIGVVETGFSQRCYTRRAKTPSPKRSKFVAPSSGSNSHHGSTNGMKPKTPSPRSLSPKYCRRSSNCSVSSSSSESNLVYGGSRKSSYSGGKTPSLSLSPQRNIGLKFGSSSSSTRSNSPTQTQQPLKTYHVGVIGSESVGKKCLLSVFGEVEEPSSPNLASVYKHPDYNFNIKFVIDSNSTSHLYKYDGIILMYSISDRSSFNFVQSVLSKTELLKTKAVVLIANKCDLQRGRCVEVEEPLNLSKFYNIKHIETSISLNINIDNLQSGLCTQLELKNCSAAAGKKNLKLIQKLRNWGTRRLWSSCLDLKSL